MASLDPIISDLSIFKTHRDEDDFDLLTPIARNSGWANMNETPPLRLLLGLLLLLLDATARVEVDLGNDGDVVAVVAVNGDDIVLGSSFRLLTLVAALEGEGGSDDVDGDNKGDSAIVLGGPPPVSALRKAS